VDNRLLGGLLLMAAGNLLYHLNRSCARSPLGGRRRLGHVFHFVGGAAGFAGLVYLVPTEGWWSVVYAFATSFVVIAYLRGGLLRADRSTRIIGLLLVVAILINVGVLMLYL
jgi:hypothetical protein